MCTNTRAIWEREKRYLHDIHLFATVTIKWHFYYRGSKRKIADRYEPKKKTANCEQWIATFQLEAIVFISISIECRAFFLFRFSISFSFFYCIALIANLIHITRCTICELFVVIQWLYILIGITSQIHMPTTTRSRLFCFVSCVFFRLSSIFTLRAVYLLLFGREACWC